MIPRLIVTCGDVNGIGLECFIGALHQKAFDANIVLACNTQTLDAYIQVLRLDASVNSETLAVGPNKVTLRNLDNPVELDLGHMHTAAGAHAIASLELAAAEVSTGNADAVVTLPINKEGCALAGFEFPGQTEFFGRRWGGQPLMLLTHNNVRVALATVHVPIRMVAGRITSDHVSERINMVRMSLMRDFGIARPRIAVLALNPHAGENGNIGTEELDVLDRTIELANEKHPDTTVEGPFAADGFFGFGMYNNFDGILAMYHDQGLIPLKLLAEGAGVNVTAGLAHVRTSPDHGTAYDIAGKGVANPQSTIEALNTAVTIVNARRRIAEI